MIRNLQTKLLALLVTMPLVASASPSQRAVDTVENDGNSWNGITQTQPDRADVFADLATQADASATPADPSLIDLTLISVTEPSVAALFSTAAIWLLAINWRLRRERKRRQNDYGGPQA